MGFVCKAKHGNRAVRACYCTHLLHEPKHWHDDAAMAKASERAKKLYFQCAREQMAPYHNVMHTFSGSVEVFPGITSVPLHGHTPGHSGYMISSGKILC